MIGIHPDTAALPGSYIFRETGARIAAFEREHPDLTVCRLGIGDVAYPPGRTVVRALRRAAREMGRPATFRGYPPDGGYPFLRSALSAAYARIGVAFPPDAFFVGDGAKSDGADLLAVTDARDVVMPAPAYPVYGDSAVMYGRRLVPVRACAENGFLPAPPKERCPGALVILISPNNPCGVAYPRALLSAWLAYTRACEGLLLFDNSYAAFARPGAVRSIYELDGARDIAVEVGSFSKFAAFTGLRCSYLVLPPELRCGERPLAAVWSRRQAARFNGVSYVIQRAAEAALSPEGLREAAHTLAVYRENAARLRETLASCRVPFVGGEDSPYLFAACPAGLSSRAFFERLLTQCGVAVTPGVGFGADGEGYVRLSALARRECVRQACLRLRLFYGRR